MNQWKITSRKSVFKGELFDVTEINFANKAGKKKIHHVVERDPIVSIFPLTDSYEIYLVSQYRYMLKRTTLEGVAGYVEKKETSLTAAKRELKEETGIEAMQWEEISRIEMAASVFKGRMHLFLAKELEIPVIPHEIEEEITLVRVRLDDAVKMVMNGEINHSASMIGILMLDKLRMQKKL